MELKRFNRVFLIRPPDGSATLKSVNSRFLRSNSSTPAGGGNAPTPLNPKKEEEAALAAAPPPPVEMCGMSESSERRLFTRSALSIASPYLHSPYSFQIRVGGLYLLYSLYSTQLNTPKERIRVALKDWADLMRFEQDAVNALHYDVAYVLRKLLHEKAFSFTAMPETLYFQVKKKRVERRKRPCESFVDRPSRPQELIKAEVLEELANVHEHYEKLKKSVVLESPQSDLSLIKQNLVPKLHSAVLTYYSSQRKHTDFDSQSDRDAGEGTSSQDESFLRAQLLASIKSRSYSQAVEASKSRRHRQVEVTSSDQDTDSAQHGQKFRRPPSLKSRTKSRFMTQGIQDTELQNATHLWRLTTLEGEKTGVTPEAIGFLSAVAVFVVLLTILFLFINKKLCFARVGGLPCFEIRGHRKRKERSGIHQGLGKYQDTET
ncbi:snRNA-activating protein complex subunit 1 [Bagarius yarrelli]|uniref:snRNA-activating protein complex subunit 1 n=1 Tax=Bagarius yarrelli TaxID=175774 RepID=A0A556V4Z8_BAGYA|nr:snRNA-activating protein complex subunit 1 [Bagarius yarrelli]